MIVDVALLQLGYCPKESREERFERGLGLLRSLERCVQLAIFPELWAVGYFNFKEYERSSEPIPGPSSHRFSEAARAMGIWLHAGSIIEQSPEGALYNTSLLFAPDGDLYAAYRKMHLFGYDSEESRLLKPGNTPIAVSTPFGKLALTTCYDMRFPELYRRLIEHGVETFLVTAAWPYPRLEHWLILARARAIENLAYMICCNMSGYCQGLKLLGNSMIVDPWGTPIVRAGDEEQILYGRINLDYVREVRERFPALRNRRL
jgi:predicted amidohydrolase